MTRPYQDILIEMQQLIKDCYLITLHEQNDQIWLSQTKEKFLRLNSLLAMMNEHSTSWRNRMRIKKLNKLVTEFMKNMEAVRIAN